MKQYKYFGLILAGYITFQLVSDVSAGKIIGIFSFPVSVTVLYFPVTFILGAVATEVYGYARARSIMWTVFFSSLVAGLVYWLVISLPPAPGFEANDAYVRVLGIVPRILLGGWIAVWVGGVLHNFLLAKMKLQSQGKNLWLRTIGPTFFSQLVNTVLFYTIALYTIIPDNLLVASIISAWFIKVIVEILLTPWTHYIIRKLKNVEGVEHYDRGVDFNPFIIQPPKF